MPLLSLLRLAARRAEEVVIDYGGGDPAELIALAEQVGEREGRLVACAVHPGRPGTLAVRFRRRTETDAQGRGDP